MHRDKKRLFGEAINHNQDGSVTGRLRKLFYEIHRDGIPWLLGNGELLEKPIWSMAHRFGVGTSGARLVVVLDIGWESWPIVIEVNLVKGLGLTIMPCKGMIMQVL